MNLVLYHYWRSSSSWRVRWALALKKLSVDYVHINLLNNEQNSPEHLERNPLGTVPALKIPQENGEFYLTESVAILEWLETTCPQPALLPQDPLDQAFVRQLTQIVNADTQPIQNLKVLKHVTAQGHFDKQEWGAHWISKGLGAYEKLAQKTAGEFSFKNNITMADLCLIPQCYNALRFGVNLEGLPTIHRVYQNSLQTETCKQAHPDNFQPSS